MSIGINVPVELTAKTNDFIKKMAGMIREAQAEATKQPLEIGLEIKKDRLQQIGKEIRGFNSEEIKLRINDADILRQIENLENRYNKVSNILNQAKNPTVKMDSSQLDNMTKKLQESAKLVDTFKSKGSSDTTILDPFILDMHEFLSMGGDFNKLTKGIQDAYKGIGKSNHNWWIDPSTIKNTEQQLDHIIKFATSARDEIEQAIGKVGVSYSLDNILKIEGGSGSTEEIQKIKEDIEELRKSFQLAEEHFKNFEAALSKSNETDKIKDDVESLTEKVNDLADAFNNAKEAKNNFNKSDNKSNQENNKNDKLNSSQQPQPKSENNKPQKLPEEINKEKSKKALDAWQEKYIAWYNKRLESDKQFTNNRSIVVDTKAVKDTSIGLKELMALFNEKTNDNKITKNNAKIIFEKLQNLLTTHYKTSQTLNGKLVESSGNFSLYKTPEDFENKFTSVSELTTMLNGKNKIGENVGFSQKFAYELFKSIFNEIKSSIENANTFSDGYISWKDDPEYILLSQEKQKLDEYDDKATKKLEEAWDRQRKENDSPGITDEDVKKTKNNADKEIQEINRVEDAKDKSQRESNPAITDKDVQETETNIESEGRAIDRLKEKKQELAMANEGETSSDKNKNNSEFAIADTQEIIKQNNQKMHGLIDKKEQAIKARSMLKRMTSAERNSVKLAENKSQMLNMLDIENRNLYQHSNYLNMDYADLVELLPEYKALKSRDRKTFEKKITLKDFNAAMETTFNRLKEMLINQAGLEDKDIEFYNLESAMDDRINSLEVDINEIMKQNRDYITGKNQSTETNNAPNEGLSVQETIIPNNSKISEAQQIIRDYYVSIGKSAEEAEKLSNGFNQSIKNIEQGAGYSIAPLNGDLPIKEVEAYTAAFEKLGLVFERIIRKDDGISYGIFNDNNIKANQIKTRENARDFLNRSTTPAITKEDVKETKANADAEIIALEEVNEKKKEVANTDESKISSGSEKTIDEYKEEYYNLANQQENTVKYGEEYLSILGKQKKLVSEMVSLYPDNENANMLMNGVNQEYEESKKYIDLLKDYKAFYNSLPSAYQEHVSNPNYNDLRRSYGMPRANKITDNTSKSLINRAIKDDLSDVIQEDVTYIEGQIVEIFESAISNNTSLKDVASKLSDSILNSEAYQRYSQFSGKSINFSDNNLINNISEFFKDNSYSNKNEYINWLFEKLIGSKIDGERITNAISSFYKAYLNNEEVMVEMGFLGNSDNGKSFFETSQFGQVNLGKLKSDAYDTLGYLYDIMGHTHLKDLEARFSLQDINAFINQVEETDGKLNKYFVLAQRELASIDFSLMSKEQIQKFKDIMGFDGNHVDETKYTEREDSYSREYSLSEIKKRASRGLIEFYDGYQSYDEKDRQLLDRIYSDINNEISEIINTAESVEELKEKVNNLFDSKLDLSLFKDSDTVADWKKANIDKLFKTSYADNSRAFVKAALDETLKGSNISSSDVYKDYGKNELQQYVNDLINNKLQSIFNRFSVQPNENGVSSGTTALLEQVENKAKGVAITVEEAFRGIDVVTDEVFSTKRPFTFFSQLVKNAEGYAGKLGTIFKTKLDFKNAFVMDNISGSTWDNIQYLGDKSDEASIKINYLANNAKDLIRNLSKNTNLEAYDLNRIVFGNSDTLSKDVFSSRFTDILYNLDNITLKNDTTKEQVVEWINALKNVALGYKAISDSQDNIYGTHSTDEFAKRIFASGDYDGIVFKDIFDVKNNGDISDVYIAKQKESIIASEKTTQEYVKQQKRLESVHSQIVEITQNIVKEKEHYEELVSLMNDFNAGKITDKNDLELINSGELQKAINTSKEAINSYETKLVSLKERLSELSQSNKNTPSSNQSPAISDESTQRTEENTQRETSAVGEVVDSVILSEETIEENGGHPAITDSDAQRTEENANREIEAVNGLCESYKDLEAVEHSALSQDFNVTGKNNALNALKEKSENFFKYYDEADEQTRTIGRYSEEGTQAAYEFWMAYENALEKKVNPSRLTNIMKHIWGNDAASYVNKDVDVFNSIDKYPDERDYILEDSDIMGNIQYYEQRLNNFSTLISAIEKVLGKDFQSKYPDINNKLIEFIEYFEIGTNTNDESYIQTFYDALKTDVEVQNKNNLLDARLFDATEFQKNRERFNLDIYPFDEFKKIDDEYDKLWQGILDGIIPLNEAQEKFNELISQSITYEQKWAQERKERENQTSNNNLASDENVDNETSQEQTPIAASHSRTEDEINAAWELEAALENIIDKYNDAYYASQDFYINHDTHLYKWTNPADWYYSDDTQLSSMLWDNFKISEDNMIPGMKKNFSKFVDYVIQEVENGSSEARLICEKLVQWMESEMINPSDFLSKRQQTGITEGFRFSKQKIGRNDDAVSFINTWLDSQGIDKIFRLGMDRAGFNILTIKPEMFTDFFNLQGEEPDISGFKKYLRELIAAAKKEEQWAIEEIVSLNSNMTDVIYDLTTASQRKAMDKIEKKTNIPFESAYDAYYGNVSFIDSYNREHDNYLEHMFDAYLDDITQLQDKGKELKEKVKQIIKDVFTDYLIVGEPEYGDPRIVMSDVLGEISSKVVPLLTSQVNDVTNSASEDTNSQPVVETNNQITESAETATSAENQLNEAVNEVNDSPTTSPVVEENNQITDSAEVATEAENELNDSVDNVNTNPTTSPVVEENNQITESAGTATEAENELDASIDNVNNNPTSSPIVEENEQVAETANEATEAVNQEIKSLGALKRMKPENLLLEPQSKNKFNAMEYQMLKLGNQYLSNKDGDYYKEYARLRDIYRPTSPQDTSESQEGLQGEATAAENVASNMEEAAIAKEHFITANERVRDISEQATEKLNAEATAAKLVADEMERAAKAKGKYPVKNGENLSEPKESSSNQSKETPQKYYKEKGGQYNFVGKDFTSGNLTDDEETQQQGVHKTNIELEGQIELLSYLEHLESELNVSHQASMYEQLAGNIQETNSELKQQVLTEEENAQILEEISTIQANNNYDKNIEHQAQMYEELAENIQEVNKELKQKQMSDTENKSIMDEVSRIQAKNYKAPKEPKKTPKTEAEKKVDSTINKFNNYVSSSKQGHVLSDRFPELVTNAKKELEGLNATFLQNSKDATQAEEAETQYADAVSKLFAKLKLANNQIVGKKDNSIYEDSSAAKEGFAKIAETYGTLQGDVLSTINGDMTKLNATVVTNEGNILKLAGSYSTATKQITYSTSEAGQSVTKFGKVLEGFKAKWASLMQYFTAMYLNPYMMIGKIKSQIDQIITLDTALIDLKKTTTMTSNQLEQFYYESNNVAKQMGVTTEEIINQAAAWSRLGYSSKEAATQMAALSSKFASISPGMTTDEAQSGLVTVMKAWDISYQDVESSIMDRINVLGNKFAETNSDIISGMQKSAAALSATGTSLEDAFALFTGGQEILQDSESMGTALRTISLRLKGYSEESTDDNLELDESLQTINGDLINLTKTSKNLQGISIYTDETKNLSESEKQYKSLVQYLGELSDAWDSFGETQKNSLLQKLFGKTRANAGAAIITNFDQVRKSLIEMENSAGSANREMSTIEGKVLP